LFYIELSNYSVTMYIPEIGNFIVPAMRTVFIGLMISFTVIAGGFFVWGAARIVRRLKQNADYQEIMLTERPMIKI